MVIGIVGGLVSACLIYCLVTPAQYDAHALLALRTGPAVPLRLNDAEGSYSGSFASGQVQLETLANVFRSDQIAWRVILDRKLYGAPEIEGRFSARFPQFRPEAPTAEAQAYLLERFRSRLWVRTIPRTLVLEITFRSGDGVLSAEVVSALIRGYEEQESQSRLQAATLAAGGLRDQLADLKVKADLADQRLADFQKQHGILMAPGTQPNGQPSGEQHISAVQEMDELGRELVAATSERILREADYRAASQGDPEQVLASDARMQGETGAISTAAFRQIHSRRSVLEEEQAQLSLEHGPNFPRVVEVRQEIVDLDRQLQVEDAKLLDRFRSAWKTAADREEMVRNSLAEQTGEGMRANVAAFQYEVMRREAEASRQLYLRVQGMAAEAELAAGVPSSDFWVVDAPRVPVKPSAPNLPLYLAITLFVSFWLAAVCAFTAESLKSYVVIALLALVAAVAGADGQAPTPSTSGLPTGVARIPQSKDTKATPNAKDAPPVWNGPGGMPGNAPSQAANSAITMPARIVPGDLLDVSEFQTPEFHSIVRVSPVGTVTLPMAGDVNVSDLDETEAARGIAAALVSKGMLLHPQVVVLVTVAVGQDVSVLGEVARPGVYPFGVHHRLFDLISAAAGVTQSAGKLVNIYHRDDSAIPHAIPLDPEGVNQPELNPELLPGDTVEVSRSGLVYVVGDVIRPGGFTFQPMQEMTVLQAVTLAWGPSQNAALQRALLIHEQKGGRTVTSLNLKRMLRGQDPDMQVREGDILFVPDSTAKNLWNRSLESIVQSTAGVSVYAGMVYSQRF